MAEDITREAKILRNYFSSKGTSHRDNPFVTFIQRLVITKNIILGKSKKDFVSIDGYHTVHPGNIENINKWKKRYNVSDRYLFGKNLNSLNVPENSK